MPPFKYNNIIFICKPFHIGIERNENVDHAQKKASKLGTLNELNTPANRYKTLIKSRIRDRWREEWTAITSDKLEI